MKAFDYQGDLNEFLRIFKFQPSLTKRLDSLAGIPFDQKLINEIVLWKVNRYVQLSDDLCEKIDKMETLATGEHRKATNVLEELLNVRGVDLAMASAFPRFRNKKVFQIIDRHAYRALTGKHLATNFSTPICRKLEIYFDYLDRLLTFSNERGLCFETSDRLLYVFDKQFNGKLQENRQG